MIIEFQVENFRSFKERQTFSMVGAPLSEHINSNTFDSGLKGFDRLLRSAVVYGPNAAGKTNLVRAIQFVQMLVLQSATAASASAPFPYRPFKLSKTTRSAPSVFEITFVHNNIRYQYGFSMGPERIDREWLIEHVQSRSRVRGRELFNRCWNHKTKTYDWKYGPFLRGEKTTWSKSTRDQALFLSTATQLNSAQLKAVYEWFQTKLVVIAGSVSLNHSMTLSMWDEEDGKARILPFIQEADIGVVDIKIERQPLPSRSGVWLGLQPQMLEQKPGSPFPNIVKITLSHSSDDPDEPIGFEFEDESSGTQLLFKTAGAWLNVIQNGVAMFFDEIDTNLHPKLLLFLIQKFHSKITNPNNAQLICTTHNTSLLDRDIFRRDQFWFVEKQATGESSLYPLTDFKPRNDEVIERWYMRGRYGALPILPAAAK